MSCKIEGCNDAVHYTYLSLCKACYSGFAYWKGRSKRDKIKRSNQLNRLNARMAHLVDNPRNVPHKRKKR